MKAGTKLHKVKQIDFARITLDVMENKGHWVDRFSENPLIAMKEMTTRLGISTVAARNLCDALGIPRLRRDGSPRKKEAPMTKAARIDALEQKVSRLTQSLEDLHTWCSNLAHDLQYNKPIQ